MAEGDYIEAMGVAARLNDASADGRGRIRIGGRLRLRSGRTIRVASILETRQGIYVSEDEPPAREGALRYFGPYPDRSGRPLGQEQGEGELSVVALEDGAECTPREAAALMHVATYTVYKLIRDGRLPAAKRDGRWHIPASEVRSMSLQRGDALGPEEVAAALPRKAARLLLLVHGAGREGLRSGKARLRSEVRCGEKGLESAIRRLEGDGLVVVERTGLGTGLVRPNLYRETPFGAAVARALEYEAEG